MSTLLKADQGSEEWKQGRVGIPTTSKFNDIIARIRSGAYAASRATYMAEKVLERLTGELTAYHTTAEMTWGTETEPVARLAYQLETGNDVEETGLWIHDTIKVGASPDGFVNHDGLLEIKCPKTTTHFATLTKRKVPPQYIPQVQGQMWMTGRKWCDFVSFDPRLPENAQMIIIRVERDEEYIKMLEEEIIKFNEEVDKQVEFIQNYGK